MKRSTENRSRRLALKRLEQWVIEQHTGHFDFDALADAEVPIHVTAMLKPHFFQPYPDDQLGAIDPDRLATPFPAPGEADDNNEYWLYNYMVRFSRAYMPSDGGDLPIIYDTGMAFKFKHEYGFDQLVETPGFDPELHIWMTRSIYSYKNPNVPHLKCFVTSEVDGDERLLRGELLCLLRMMRGRLRNSGFENHVVAPVLMLSVMRKQHARIIEGYFDGNELVVSKSPLYDFTNEENAPLRLFARYLLGGTTGSITGPAVAAKCVLGHPSVVNAGIPSH